MSMSEGFMDLEEYIRQGEPAEAEKSSAWKTAIGLQAVDGLKTSKYLLETAKEHIEGKIDISDVQKRISAYYEQRDKRVEIEDRTMEADVVSARITELLGDKSFQFSPATYQFIHKRLFDGVFDLAGKLREYNITKKEWVLNGDTVMYASWGNIKPTLDYDFMQEKSFVYEGISIQDFVKHISRFTAGIWQIHPFCEGNTRTTAVFVIKYLQTFGFYINNTVFAENSWYFRNALVRANYNNLQKGIHATVEFLEKFFQNLLLNTKHELKNRYLHVDYGILEFQSAKKDVSKCKICTLDCTLEEMTILRAVAVNPRMTQKELAGKIGRSARTVKDRMIKLQEKGYLRRVNGKRNGAWELLVDIENNM